MGCGYDLALTPEFSNTPLYKTMNIQSIILLLLIAAAAVWAWWFHHSQGGVTVATVVMATATNVPAIAPKSGPKASLSLLRRLLP